MQRPEIVIAPELVVAFVAAMVVLVLVPGPNVALIVANSLAYGPRYGLLTVAGTSMALPVQLGLVVFGMHTVLGTIAEWFESLRWLGVAYLVYLGVRTWRAPAVDLTHAGAQPRSATGIFFRGFAVSLTNPKTLLFYSAFLPQFVTPGHDVTGQLLGLSAIAIVLVVVLDSGWALLAARVRRSLAIDGRLRNRLTGGILIGAAVGLALARRP